MKKSLLLPLLGFSALMCGCVTYPYAAPGYAGVAPVYEPGYVVAYGEPVYVYGGVNYYHYRGRYCYLDHGRRIYVNHIPHGARRYHGPSHMHHGGYYRAPQPSYRTQPYYRTGKYNQVPPHDPNIHVSAHHSNTQPQRQAANIKQPQNPDLRKTAPSGIHPPARTDYRSRDGRKKENDIN